jgi:hypothetical protein
MKKVIRTQKNMFQVKKKPKIRIRATQRNMQARPKILKKIIGTPNQPINTKIFPKKVCLVPQK